MSRDSKKQPLLTAKQTAELFDTLAESISPTPELNHGSKLDLIVAVVLSAQSTDKQVNKVTEELWKTCKTCQDYIDLGEEVLAEKIKTLGLYRNKAKSIVGLCKDLLENHDGDVPNTMEELIRLQGVGRKTANVVLNVGFGMPTVPVDTHVFRVDNRTGLVNEKTPEKTELQLLKKIPKKHLQHAHHYLLLHGRYTCKAIKPSCQTCQIAQLCKKSGLNKQTQTRESQGSR